MQGQHFRTLLDNEVDSLYEVSLSARGERQIERLVLFRFQDQTRRDNVDGAAEICRSRFVNQRAVDVSFVCRHDL